MADDGVPSNVGRRGGAKRAKALRRQRERRQRQAEREAAEAEDRPTRVENRYTPADDRSTEEVGREVDRNREGATDVERATRTEGAGGGRTADKAAESLAEDAPEVTPERDAAGELRGRIARETDGQVRPTDVPVEREGDRVVADTETATRRAVARRAGPGVDPDDVRVEDGEARLSDEALRERAARRDERFEADDLEVTTENGERVVEATRRAQRDQLRQQAQEEYGEDARVISTEQTDDGLEGRVNVGDDTVDVVGGARQLATEPGEFFGDTIAGRLDRQTARERRRIAQGIEDFQEGAREGVDRSVELGESALDRLGADGDTQSAAAPVVAVPVAPFVAAGVAGATVAAGQQRVSAAETAGDAVVESEIDVSEDARLNEQSEIDVSSGEQVVESELEPAPAQQEQSELDVPEETAAERSEVDVPEQPGREQPEIDIGSGSSGGSQPDRSDDSAVSSEYPLPGRDFPADPTQDYVGSQRRVPDVEAASLQGTLGEQEERSGERMQPWERRRRQIQQERERREILGGPDGQVTIGRERPEWWRIEQDSFVFPGSSAGEAATQPELDVQQTLGLETSTTQRAGPLSDIGPTPATDVGTQTRTVQDQAQQVDQQLAQQAAQATAAGYGYPSEPGYGFEYPYPTQQAMQTVQQQATRRAARPQFGSDDEGDSSRDPDEIAYREWERPVADAEDVFALDTDDLIGSEMPDFDAQTPGFDREDWG